MVGTGDDRRAPGPSDPAKRCANAPMPSTTAANVPATTSRRFGRRSGLTGPPAAAGAAGCTRRRRSRRGRTVRPAAPRRSPARCRSPVDRLVGCHPRSGRARRPRRSPASEHDHQHHHREPGAPPQPEPHIIAITLLRARSISDRLHEAAGHLPVSPPRPPSPRPLAPAGGDQGPAAAGGAGGHHDPPGRPAHVVGHAHACQGRSGGPVARIMRARPGGSWRPP